MTALTVLALVAGFALATFGFNAPIGVQQGSQTANISPVVGLTFNSMQLVDLQNNLSNRTCSSASPCSVQSQNATDCAGGVTGATGCLKGDFVEEVSLETSATQGFTGTNAEVCLTVDAVVNGATDTGTTFCYTNAAPTQAESIEIFFDVGTSTSGPESVSSVTVVANTPS
jgi:hypothetical protein